MNLKNCKTLLRYFGIFSACIASYLILLVVTNLIPTSWIYENLQKSSETLITENEKQYIHLPYKDEMLFYYSDALILNLITSVDSSHPFESALLSRKSYVPEYNQIQNTTINVSIPADSQYLEPDQNCLIREFYGMTHGDVLTTSWEYNRYWHGHQVLLRPLLLLFDLEGIRILFFVCMLLLLLLFFFFTTKKLGVLTAIAFTIGFLSASVLTLTRSLNEALLFLFTLGSMIFLLCRYRKEKNFGPFFFVIGSIINYFDLLTSPMLGCILPLTLLLVCKLRIDHADWKELLKTFFLYGFLWVMGYAFTWLVKWILVDVFFDRGLLLQAFEQIHIRSTDITLSPAKTFERVYLFLSPNVIYFVATFAVILGVVQWFRNRKKKRNYAELFKLSIPFWISATFPFLWCLLIRNHAFLHPFFTYRLFSITIVDILLLILLFTSYDSTEEKTKQLPEKELGS